MANYRLGRRQTGQTQVRPCYRSPARAKTSFYYRLWWSRGRKKNLRSNPSAYRGSSSRATRSIAACHLRNRRYHIALQCFRWCGGPAWTKLRNRFFINTYNFKSNNIRNSNWTMTGFPCNGYRSSFFRADSHQSFGG